MAVGKGVYHIQGGEGTTSIGSGSTWTKSDTTTRASSPSPSGSVQYVVHCRIFLRRGHHKTLDCKWFKKDGGEDFAKERDANFEANKEERRKQSWNSLSRRTRQSDNRD